MIHALSRNWGWIALRGVAAIVFGILALLQPASAFAVLVIFFGAYCFVDGVFALVALFRGGAGDRFWVLVLEAVVGIAIGILTIAAPTALAGGLLWYIGAWAIITGVLEIVAAIRLRKEITGELWLGLAGLLSIAFGILLFVAPGAGAFAITIWIGAYALVFGVMLLFLAFRLKKFSDLHNRPEMPRTPAPAAR
jgi:uncharacterized membrane protein HdeD (DUF308 family)